ncbi:MAG: LuxR C-terminal-related transcriptional regulator [Coriobacteriia bacterium]
MRNEPHPSTLLTTKLQPPRLPESLVARDVLVAKLDEVVCLKAVIVSAAAGYGKSTLLGQWASHARVQTAAPLAVAWLTLDAADNDSDRFWQHLLAAIDVVLPGIRQGALSLLSADNAAVPKTFLDTLINELNELTTAAYLAQPCDLTIVLDDYHVIENAELHTSVSYLLDNLPIRVHLMIASRTRPPFSIARLRARNEVLEMDAADLRFNDEEAAEFLKCRMGLSSSAEDIKVLQRVVEGWAAGLQLSALGAGKEEGVLGLVRRLGESDRNVADFLTAEVLGGQSPDVADFLLKTSVLDSLSGALCDYLVQRKDSQGVLEGLESANLFIVPLDSSGTWFRYHQLFANSLRSQLVRTQPPEAIQELHRRASDWYDSNDMPAEAVGHARAAGDWARLARLLEANYRSAAMPVLVDLNDFPESVFDRFPVLNLVRIWTLIGADRPGDAEDRLRILEKTMQSAGSQASALANRLRPEITVLRATAAAQRGDVVEGIRLANEALLQAPEEDLFLRSWALNAAGTAASRGEDPAEITSILEECRAGARIAGNLTAELIAQYFSGQQYVRTGRLRRAKRIYEEMQDRITHKDAGRLSFAGLAWTGMGDLKREWNDLRGAEELLLRGIESIRRGTAVEFLADAYVALARIRRAQGDPEAGLRILEDTALFAREHRTATRIAVVTDAWRACFQMETGDRKAALRWAEAYDPRAMAHDVPVREARQLALAKVLAGSGQVDSALVVLDGLISSAAAAGRSGTMIQALVLRAVVLHSEGRRQQAFSALRGAIDLARPEGYVRVFADEGPPMCRLLHDYADSKQGEPTGLDAEVLEYVETLLLALGSSLISGGDAGDGRISSPALKGLTPREVEVARLLALGYSNREVAVALYVSESTVHTHRANVYAKLGVANRRELVEAVQVLGI